MLLPNGKPLPVVLMGNKCDLDDAEVDTQKLEVFCKEKGFVQWFDTSAKLNQNIDKAVRCLVEKILEHKDIFATKRSQQATFQPGLGSKNAKKTGCC